MRPCTPKKRLKTLLDVVSEHAAEEDTAQQEEEIKKAKSDALFWNLCLGLCPDRHRRGLHCL